MTTVGPCSASRLPMGEAARAMILSDVLVIYRRERAAMDAPDLPQLDLDPPFFQSK